MFYNIFMKRKQIWLIEIIVWLFIIFCGCLFFIYQTNIKDNVQNTYYIFFDDVEGLIREEHYVYPAFRALSAQQQDNRCR